MRAVEGDFRQHSVAGEPVLDVERDTCPFGGGAALDAEVHLVGTESRANLANSREIERARFAVERAHAKHLRNTTGIAMEEQISCFWELRAEQQARNSMSVDGAGCTAPSLLARYDARSIGRMTRGSGIPPFLHAPFHALCPTHGHLDTLKTQQHAKAAEAGAHQQ